MARSSQIYSISRRSFSSIIPKDPLFINYFITRKCNYKCGFCFHTAKNEYYLPIDDAKRGLAMLAEYGLEKVNFAGGEPFIIQRGAYLGELCKFIKKDLKIDKVSIISNGSVIREKWMKEYGKYVDMMAVSVDSFNQETNIKIGRTSHNKLSQMNVAYAVAELCEEYNVPFKLNTVVNSLNWNENMKEHIIKLKPMRWKIFQCLLLEGENIGADALRDATKLVVTDAEFKHFVSAHSDIETAVIEDNDTMRNSYYLIDEEMRFLNCAHGKKVPTESILEVGVEAALQQVFFDKDSFNKRGGDFNIKKQILK